jgi:VIT1/CCC1 family predicted Fe2+/Mn2+ transporter
MNQNLFAINIGEDFLIAPNKGIAEADQFRSIGGLISVILPNLYVLAGLILLFFLIFGGLTVILGAGKGDSAQTEKGKKTLTNTLIGFLVIFASYWIIQLLEIITGVAIFN